MYKLAAIMNNKLNPYMTEMENKLIKEITLILFLLIALIGCKKHENNQVTIDCSHNNFVATVGSSSFKAAEVDINTQDCGPNSTSSCTFTEIYANTALSTYNAPPNSLFIFYLINSTPGTYYLGKIGAKKDSLNLYTGDAEYDIYHTLTSSEGYETDSIHNGILTITKKDEQNRQLYGTFNFKAKKYSPNDTITLIFNGNFQGCY
jgi:hypothetical protein